MIVGQKADLSNEFNELHTSLYPAIRMECCFSWNCL